MPPAPAISFLLCTRNRSEIARGCVLHLLGSSRRDIEVIVRDNCSTDDTVESLGEIEDDRLKIHVAPENEGTINFFEISKLASGDIVTWLSDEDDFQFTELDYILSSFEQNPTCNVMFGSIAVGANGRLMFADEVITDPVRSLVTAFGFSGCGGVFVRRTALAAANSLNVRDQDDAYSLWNYYPVGFFASRCLTQSLITMSRIVVVQARFARTTNNWSIATPGGGRRAPHYYPESVFERLASNLVNVFYKPLPARTRLDLARELIRRFRLHATSYSNPVFHDLLRENYPADTVQRYLDHIRHLRLDRPRGRVLWSYARILALPVRSLQTLRHWSRLGAKIKVTIQ
jgi:glycosyltransferase involved in cell wall biosynthesis